MLGTTIPAFAGISNWWNTADGQPLTPESLKGKVVLVDFWTYSCINCIRTQPVLRKWWDTYKNDGLVIVGVHTPEFAFEKDPQNVDEAIKKAQLLFPIALDPTYDTWNAYQNRYWPAEYLFDRDGRLRHTHFGEGSYAESEMAIRSLLAEAGTVPQAPTGIDTSPAPMIGQTSETYFGLSRQENFENTDELAPNVPSTYQLRTPSDNAWTIGGSWTISDEKAVSLNADNTFHMNVSSNAMHLVLGSTDGPRTVRVLVDGTNPTDAMLTTDSSRQPDGTATLTINEKRLYRIARFPDGGRHTVELRIQDAGIEFYAATFGE